MSCNTIGFWRQGSRFLSSVLFKGQISPWCRIEVVKNTFHKVGDKLPDYVGYLVPAKQSKRIDVKNPISVLRKQEALMDERGDELAVGILEWIRDHQDEITAAYRHGVDSSPLYDMLVRDFE